MLKRKWTIYVCMTYFVWKNGSCSLAPLTTLIYYLFLDSPADAETYKCGICGSGSIWLTAISGDVLQLHPEASWRPLCGPQRHIQKCWNGTSYLRKRQESALLASLWAFLKPVQAVCDLCRAQKASCTQLEYTSSCVGELRPRIPLQAQNLLILNLQIWRQRRTWAKPHP